MKPQLMIEWQNAKPTLLSKLNDKFTDRVERMIVMLDEMGATNIEVLLNEIKTFSQSGDAIEGTMDICAQGMFGVGLLRAGFGVEFNPTGSKGPDVKFVYEGAEYFADVRRLREDKPLNKILLDAFCKREAVEYGNEPKAFNQIGGALSSKSAQAPNYSGSKPPFLVFILSMNDNTETGEFKRKTQEIVDTAAGGGPHFSEVSGAVFTASTGPLTTQTPSVWINPNADKKCLVDPAVVSLLGTLNIYVG